MKCGRCDEDIQAGWKACPSCGQKVAEKRTCGMCGREVEGAWQFCPFCGKSATIKTASSEKVDRQVDRIEIYDFLYECGLDADEADKKAGKLVGKMTEDEFSLLKDSYEWALETIHGYDTDFRAEALENAETVSSALLPEQFPLAQEVYGWALETIWGDDSDSATEALDLAVDLLQTADFDEARFELFKDVYAWADEEVHGSDADMRDESLTLAKSLISRISPKVLEKLKESFSKAVEELEKEPEDALAYARKRLGL